MTIQEHNFNSSNFLKFEEFRIDQFVVYSVFEKNYNLLTFPELKTFINTHKHLPSAKEKERQNVGEINRILTIKVEELTHWKKDCQN